MVSQTRRSAIPVILNNILHSWLPIIPLKTNKPITPTSINLKMIHSTLLYVMLVPLSIGLAEYVK